MAKDITATLNKFEQELPRRVGQILWRNLGLLQAYLRAEAPLQQRTKGMPYVRRPLQLQGNLIQAGLYSPPAWAGVHIGPPGTTTITPKGGKQYLAIPTDFVKTYRDQPFGPRHYGGTVIFDGIIWGQAGWGGAGTGGGLRQRRAAGERFKKQSLIPLFILKGSVVVRRRINPADLIAWVKPKFLADLQENALVP